MCGGLHTHTSARELCWSQKLFVSSTPLLLQTVYYLLNSTALLHLILSSIELFTLTLLLNLLIACLPLPCRPAANDFQLVLIPINFSQPAYTGRESE